MPAVRRPHPLRVAVLSIALLAALAPLLAVAAPARAALHAVAILDGSFSPASLTITVGDSITWTNEDDSPHTVTSVAGAFDSGNLDSGGFFAFTFSEPGTYTYVCNYHDEMRATIVVQPASAPAPAPAAGSSGGDEAGTGDATTDPATAGGIATAGGGDAAATTGTAAHAGGEHGGAQPDTALPLQTPAPLAWLAPLLIGLGLVALAFGVVPMRSARPRPVAATRARPAGWRR